MAIIGTKVNHLVGDSPMPSMNLAPGTLYYVKQSDGQYVIYLAEDATTARRITTILDSAPSTNGSGNIATGDTIVSAFGKVQGRLNALEEKSASMFSVKGTIGTGGTVTSLPANPKTGDAYRVITEGTYGDHEVEVNDWLVCSFGGSNPTWVVLQGNIELDDVAITATSDNNGYNISISGSGIDTSVSIPYASASEGGFMSSTQATKLAGIEAGANAYSLPTANGSTLGGVKLSDATNNTSNASSGVAATPKAVKDAYDLANSKWTYNEATIKTVKVDNAAAADKATSDGNNNDIASTYFRKTNNGTDIPQRVDNSTSFERDVTFGASIIVGDDMVPNGNNGADIGTSELKFGTVYAETFDGTASYANIASTANKTKGKLTASDGSTSTTFDGSSDVTINKATLGLGNVENTADADKEVKHADSAEQLDVAPSLSANGNKIKVTAGGKSSNELTVPFATNATNATNAENAENATNATNATNAEKATVATQIQGESETVHYSYNDFTFRGGYNGTASDIIDELNGTTAIAVNAEQIAEAADAALTWSTW